ncbi:HCN2 [Symbiodinium sp. CCMP2456]|nr:HCN2 [Symbiodinium sp. CCMP2456]
MATLPAAMADTADFHSLIQQVIACYESERARGDQLQTEKASLQSDLRKAATPIERRPSVPQLLAPPDASPMQGSVKGTFPAASPIGKPPALYASEGSALGEVPKQETPRSRRGSTLSQSSCNSRQSYNSEDPEHEGPPVSQTRSLVSAASELTLLPLWTQEHRPKSRRMNSSFNIPRSKSWVSNNTFTSLDDYAAAHNTTGLRSGDVLTEHSIIQKFMLNPSGWVSVLWDFVSVVFVFYDLITLPLQVFSFSSWFLSAGDTGVALVWTLDILVSFLRGVTDGGAVDMRPSYVAMKYIRTWFCVDVSVVVTDWILLLSNGMDDMELLQVLRMQIGYPGLLLDVQAKEWTVLGYQSDQLSGDLVQCYISLMDWQASCCFYVTCVVGSCATSRANVTG